MIRRKKIATQIEKTFGAVKPFVPSFPKEECFLDFINFFDKFKTTDMQKMISDSITKSGFRSLKDRKTVRSYRV